MKTTLEIPDPIFRRAKTLAAARGISLRQLVTEALDDKLRKGAIPGKPAEPPWMKGFGGLSGLRSESAKLMRLIEEEFEQTGAQPKT
jgi:hypothetical protein